MRKLKLAFASFALGALFMAAPLTALACSSGFTISDWDSGSSWNCYYAGEDSEYCYYWCYEQ